jgi:hypothetical protein
MADARRINRRKIRDVMRLKLEARLSHEQAAVALTISTGVVTEYRALANTAGLDWAQIQTLGDTALHNRMLDSPKALIANADRYEPRANETGHDLARHYATSFFPARP